MLYFTVLRCTKLHSMPSNVLKLWNCQLKWKIIHEHFAVGTFGQHSNVHAMYLIYLSCVDFNKHSRDCHYKRLQRGIQFSTKLNATRSWNITIDQIFFFFFNLKCFARRPIPCQLAKHKHQKTCNFVEKWEKRFHRHARDKIWCKLRFTRIETKQEQRTEM